MYTEPLPSENVQLFERVIAQYFPHETFLGWKTILLDELKIEPYNIENELYLNKILEEELLACEVILFP